MSYQTAAAACESEGGQLTSIHDVGEAKWLVTLSLLSGGIAWIGQNDITTEGTMVNIDGTPLDFYWPCSGQFDNSGGNEDYVLLWGSSATGCLNDVGSYGNARSYICKRSAGCRAGDYYTPGDYTLLGNNGIQCSMGYKYPACTSCNVTATCTGISGAKCLACPEGTYQSIEGNMGGISTCRPCTRSVPDGYYVAALCSATTDIVILPCSAPSTGLLARYIKISNDDYIHLSEIEVYSPSDAKLIVKGAYASSYYGSAFSVKPLFDGSVYTFFHSGIGDAAPWLLLDMGKMTLLGSLIIINRDSSQRVRSRISKATVTFLREDFSVIEDSLLYFNGTRHAYTFSLLRNTYVSQICNPGSLSDSLIGSDTTLLPCSISSPGKYVSVACIPGNYNGRGSNGVIAGCSLPSAGQYVASVCRPGNSTVAGADTLVQTCSPTTYPLAGQYAAVSACIAGSYDTIGSDIAFCPVGTYTVSSTIPCAPVTKRGDWACENGWFAPSFSMNNQVKNGVRDILYKHHIFTPCQTVFPSYSLM